MNYNIVTATQSVLRQYANFSGRATRSEFWWFNLALFLFSLIFGLLVGLLMVATGVDLSWLSTIFGLAILLPCLAVTVRRLHDTGRSGWNVLWGFVPYVGGIIMIVLCCLDSQTGTNKYGQSEKYPDTL